MRRKFGRLAHPAIYFLFLMTGFSALVYQVVWGRLFGLVFGNTVYASSAVLAAYFAGLALGSYLAGRHLAGRKDPLRIFAFIELLTGEFGALIPLLMPGLTGLYGWIYRSLQPTFGALTAIRLLFSLLMLSVPCLLMGTTLPVMAGFLADAQKSRQDSIGKLYGINTLGAVLGALASGFFLIGRLGVLRTSLAAAVLNAAAALGAFMLHRRQLHPNDRVRSAGSAAAVPTSPTAFSSESKGRLQPLLAAYGLAGFAALALEVAWTRAMVWIIGQDSYAFAAMLCVVLCGIGLGSLIISPYIERIRDERPFLYGSQFFLGVFVVLSIAAVHGGHDLVKGILTAVNAWAPLRAVFVGLGAYTLIQIIVASSILLVPALIMGAAFPLFARACVRLSGSVGRGVGIVYSVNTLGGIAGSLAMGFLIIPALGLLPAIALMGALYLGLSLLLLSGAGSQKPLVRLAQAVGATGAALPLFLSVNLDFSAVLGKTLKSAGDYRFEKVLYYREHATGTVMVKESELYGTEMLIDGLQVASTGDFDLHSHLYPAHLMSLLKDKPQEVLVVAFGAGGTSGSLLLYDEIRRLDVVEICEGVVEPAKRYFTEMNSNVFSDPRLHLIIQDGKNYVRMTDRKYDIIYSGPIHPQSNQGSAALYTKEYFEDCRDRLAPGGFQCLWLPLHVTHPVYFKIILKTFMEVYPHVTLWQLPYTENSASHPHLIGSLQPIYPEYQIVARKLQRPRVRRDLARLHDARFSRPYEFFAQLAMDGSQLRELAAGAESLNTDDLPVVEYYRHTVDLVASSKASKASLLSEIAKHMQHPLRFVRNVPDSERAELAKELDRLYEGYRRLLIGHGLIALSEFSGEDLERFIREYYRQAYVFLPESDYLRRYLTGPQGS